MKSQDLWKRAKEIIPGGTQLFSKRAELFLPDIWPTYYSYAKGIHVWDLDDCKYLDFSSMGIGTCILGYQDDDVDTRVIKAIHKGVMTTLNCKEEVELAELLLQLHPWFDMVRFAKTGGEATTIAIRLARAYTGKVKVAFSGYHGWHDWYLSANITKDNLSQHLLPGLEPLGVPSALVKTALPFTNLQELEKLVQEESIGTVIMEVIRHNSPDIKYLTAIRKLCHENGIVLIFDEVTSGFRETIGGYHKMLPVKPDVAVFGKGMSNGYPMSAIVGKQEIMDKAQESFISSTYWTDRVGFVASLATIDKMEREQVPSALLNSGNLIRLGWMLLAKKYNLDITIHDGFLPIISFTFNKDHQRLRTFFTQEMLKRGYLATNTVYVSYCHTKEFIKDYINNVDEVFGLISEGKIKLNGSIAQSGFKRLV